MLLIELSILVLLVVVLAITVLIYNHVRNEKFDPLNMWFPIESDPGNSVLDFNRDNKRDVYDYVAAYDAVYKIPRPTFYDECPEYNVWVKNTNQLANHIATECKKRFPDDKNCPKYIP